MSAADRATLDVTGAPGAARGLTRREVWANLSTASATLAVIHSTVVLMPLVNPNPALAIWLQLYRYTAIGLLMAVPSFIGGVPQLVFGYLGRSGGYHRLGRLRGYVLDDWRVLCGGGAHRIGGPGNATN